MMTESKMKTGAEAVVSEGEEPKTLDEEPKTRAVGLFESGISKGKRKQHDWGRNQEERSCLASC